MFIPNTLYNIHFMADKGCDFTHRNVSSLIISLHKFNLFPKNNNKPKKIDIYILFGPLNTNMSL